MSKNPADLQREAVDSCRCAICTAIVCEHQATDWDGEPVEKNPAAAALGSLGGKAQSEAKSEAARENGKKGGRPIKMDDATFAALDRIIRYVSDLPGHPMADDCFTVSDWMDRR